LPRSRSDQTDAGHSSKSREGFDKKLALIERLSPQVQQMLMRREITICLVRDIAEVEKPLQEKLAKAVVKEKLGRASRRALVQILKESPEKAEVILSKPLKLLAQLYERPHHLKRFLEMDPEAAVVSTEHCPYCTKPLLVDWVEQKIRRRGDVD